MTNREKIEAELFDDENPIFFASPDYDTAIIGLSEQRKVVYSFSKMIDCLIERGGMTEDEAVEWLEYNTCCFSERDNYPIIIHEIE